MDFFFINLNYNHGAYLKPSLSNLVKVSGGKESLKGKHSKNIIESSS